MTSSIVSNGPISKEWTHTLTRWKAGYLKKTGSVPSKLVCRCTRRTKTKRLTAFDETSYNYNLNQSVPLKFRRKIHVYLNLKVNEF